MYNETYDDYIRNILGYSTKNQFEQYNYEPQEYQDYQEYRNPTFNTNINISGNNVEIENSYPEIYKIVYPMVSKKCDNMRDVNITRDDIENMTNEIYYALESQNETRVNINLSNDVNKKISTSANVSATPKNSRVENRKPDVKISETVGENNEKRQINGGLRDLIQILLIRELLNRRRPPFRPPMPNPPGPGPRPPMRPPFRPGPGRPPFNRAFGSFDELYEQF